VPDAVTLLNPDWFNAGVTLAAALLGAAAGAVPAFILANRSSREVLERDREARREAEKAAAMRVHVKLGAIVNSIITLRRQLDSAIKNPPIAGAELWQAVEPVIGFGGDERIQFAADEAAVFVSAAKFDYAEALLLLARRHAVHAEVLQEYAAGRERLRQAMPPPDEVVDGRGSTPLTAVQYMRVRPMMVSLNSLIEQLLTHLAEDMDLALALARDFGSILRPYFKDDRFPAFTIPDDPTALVAVRRYAPLASAE
jgi:hypothetical protein